jgi:hypothetical protein
MLLWRLVQASRKQLKQQLKSLFREFLPGMTFKRFTTRVDAIVQDRGNYPDVSSLTSSFCSL